jgi:hypothetical protein
MSADQPWYHSGLCFSCTRCGNCCTGEPGVVWVDDGEIQAIAEHLQVSTEEVRLLHTRAVGRRISLRERANGDCTFFDPDTRSCTIYPVRPRQCRSWPFWNSNLASPAAWEAVQHVCPGAGRGTLHSLAEIQQESSLIDV